MSTTHDDGPLAARVRHVETLLEERGWLADGELDERIDAFAAGGSPANGAAIVARAWVDPGFRERLLADASTAIEELGMSMAAGLQVQPLVAVANTADEHHVVVCTLCSCYPVSLLGPSPTWYKSEAYRSRVVRDPRGVLREFGLELPDAVRDHRLGRERRDALHGGATPPGGHRRPVRAGARRARDAQGADRHRRGVTRAPARPRSARFG